MTGPGRVVVAGAGLAGLRTIEELRGRGYDGAITLVGAESRPPYDRPPLSKKLMIGALDDTSLRAELDSLAVDVRLGESAPSGLADGRVRTDQGDRYDSTPWFWPPAPLRSRCRGRAASTY